MQDAVADLVEGAGVEQGVEARSGDAHALGLLDDLDLGVVRDFWDRWFDRGPWAVEDLYYGLIGRFVGRVVVSDPAAFAAVLNGREQLYRCHTVYIYIDIYI